jgi:hypothetical protein
MSGNRDWRNWLARLIDISGPLALAAGALVLGMRVERESAPAWEGWVLALLLGASQWRWRTLSPKDAAVAAGKQYRLYALVTTAGRILLPPCLLFTTLSGLAYALFPLLVFGWGMWMRRLEQELKETDSLIERHLVEVRLIIEPLPRPGPPTAFPAP